METPVRAEESFSIEEEYNNTLRTESNACFLAKKERFEALLDTDEEDLISPVLQNMMLLHRRTSSEIQLAVADYFDASSEASEMCRQLLRNIESTQSNYQSMDTFLASMSDGTAAAAITGADASEPVIVRSNPFCTTTRGNFRQIHDRHSSILQSIKSSHRKVAMKLKIVKAVRKLCLVTACGAAAAAAVAAAGHLLLLCLLIRPAAAAGLCAVGALNKRRVTATAAKVARKKKRSSGNKTTTTTSSLRRLREQLDTAAKGAYVLGRDLDTVSQLVARLSDGIERENAMARRCAERSGERCPVQEMVSELRRSCSSSRRLAEELEEHVWLCLATIHRARALVIQEISKQA